MKTCLLCLALLVSTVSAQTLPLTTLQGDPVPTTTTEPLTTPVLRCPSGWFVEVWHASTTPGWIAGPGQVDQDGYRAYREPEALVRGGSEDTSTNHPARCVKSPFVAVGSGSGTVITGTTTTTPTSTTPTWPGTTTVPGIILVQVILDSVEALDNPKAKPCGPDNHDTACVDPTLRHITNRLYSTTQERCEQDEGVPCKQLPPMEPGHEYWVPVGKPVYVDETPITGGDWVSLKRGEWYNRDNGITMSVTGTASGTLPSCPANATCAINANANGTITVMPNQPAPKPAHYK